MDAQSADLVRVRRQAIHALIDLALMVTSVVTAIFWASDGHGRDAFLLLVVCYWAVPWRERTHG